MNQRLTIATVTTPLQGEYGIRNVAMSLPSIVGVNGVEKRLEEQWNNAELEKFIISANSLAKFLKGL